MLYQLSNGRVIEISTEKYFELSDNEIQDLEGSGNGDFIEDPFSISVLKYGFKEKENKIEIELLEIYFEDELNKEDISQLLKTLNFYDIFSEFK